MCGIVGVVANTPVNQLLYDALLLLQHRGQDAAGICTVNGNRFHMHKGGGLARDVFRTRNMRSLPGISGIAQVRYPTQGSANDAEEAQPFYVNAPFGISLVHNGNLTNAERMKEEMFRNDRRHINTNSDSEVLLNVLAHELEVASDGIVLDPATIFRAVSAVHRRLRGAYAVVAQIAGYGLLAFRDPYGIRPLCFGVNETDHGTEYMVASESVALDGLGFHLVRDVAPGEAIFIDDEGRFFATQCAENTSLNPCLFEYVYLARPDSMMDGVSVYAARLRQVLGALVGLVDAEAQRADAIRIAKRQQPVAGDLGHDRIGTAQALVHGADRAEDRRRVQHDAVAGQLEFVRQHVEQHFGIGIGVDVAPVAAEHLVLHALGIRQIAVVHQADAEGRIDVEGLRLLGIAGRALRRIAYLGNARDTGQ